MTDPTIPRRHVEIIGDGTATTFDIPHDLDTADVYVSIVERATGKRVFPRSVFVFRDHVSVGLTTPPPPESVTVAIYA